jgi:hypothetical protein
MSTNTVIALEYIKIGYYPRILPHKQLLFVQSDVSRDSAFVNSY